MKLSMDEITELKYCHDIQNTTVWDDKKEKLRKCFPELVFAVEQHAMFDRIIKTYLYNIEELNERL